MVYVCEREKKEGGGGEEQESRVRMASSCYHIVCGFLLFDRDLGASWPSH